MNLTLEEYAERFTDEPGYLDFARIGPVGRTVRDEESAQSSLLGRARFGTLGSLHEQDDRVRIAVADAIGFRPDQIAFQPNTSQGLMHALFGMSGRVALSAAEFPSLPFAVARAAEALGTVDATWLTPSTGASHPAPSAISCPRMRSPSR